MADLSRPEMFAERLGCAEIAARVKAAGGCRFCANRVELFGLATCDLPHRTFPRCLTTPGMSFEPDHQKLGESCTSEKFSPV